MTEHIFTPPIEELNITEVGSYPDGRVNRVTALIRDAVNQIFSLTIVTQARIAEEYAHLSPEERMTLLDSNAEPIYTFPGTAIPPSGIDEVIQSIDPGLLSKYLIKQEN